MPKWRSASEFGAGRRVPLDREQRAQFRAKLKFQRRPGRLSTTAVEIGRLLADMLGADGRLDPSIEMLARLACVVPSTVVRCLARLKACGFLDWTRRLVRDAITGWRVEQGTNAYVLAVPACDVQFAPAVLLIGSKKEEAQQRMPRMESPFQSAARQLRALGRPVPIAWGV